MGHLDMSEVEKVALARAAGQQLAAAQICATARGCWATASQRVHIALRGGSYVQFSWPPRLLGLIKCRILALPSRPVRASFYCRPEKYK